MDKVPPWFLFKLLTGLIRLLGKLKDTVTPAPLRLMDMIFASHQTQLIHTAAALKLADHLKDGPMSLSDLARVSDAHEKSLYRLMRVLCFQGVFKEVRKGRYANTAISEFLRSDKPSLYHTAYSSGREWSGATRTLLETIRTGKASFATTYGMGFWELLEKDEEASYHFDRAMTEFTVAAQAAVLAEYDYSKSEHVVDVGGGLGQQIRGILNKYPHIRGTLYDMPDVIAKARGEGDLNGRLGFAEGSFFDGVPAGGDTYIMQRVIHDWNDESSIKILKNIRQVIPHNGKLLLQEPAIHRNETEALRYYADLLMFCLVEGAEREEHEYRAILEASGFELSRMIRTRSFISIVEAVPV